MKNNMIGAAHRALELQRNGVYTRVKPIMLIWKMNGGRHKVEDSGARNGGLLQWVMVVITQRRSEIMKQIYRREI